MRFSILQHITLYDTFFKKTIVIIMRDLKIIPPLMDKLYKDYVKPADSANYRLTNSNAECKIEKDYRITVKCKKE